MVIAATDLVFQLGSSDPALIPLHELIQLPKDRNFWVWDSCKVLKILHVIATWGSLTQDVEMGA
ncbi:conserved hypothetical protein [Ricinus communis]|uniref:Uncharacterized protein n=1 Tax=Ricinus communis TaxID=3988 RepID=B9S6S9_RICCO|nr:conserved hypothetical protein [Ricinus communis]